VFEFSYPHLIRFQKAQKKQFDLICAALLIFVTPSAFAEGLECIEGLTGRITEVVSVMDGQRDLVVDRPGATVNVNTTSDMVYFNGFGLDFENSAHLAQLSHAGPYRLNRVSQLGTGRTLLNEIESSDSYQPPNQITPREQAQAVASFIEQTFDEKIIASGLSHGGASAAYLAVERPDLVKALVLVATYTKDGWEIHSPAYNVWRTQNSLWRNTVWGPIMSASAEVQEDIARRSQVRQIFRDSQPQILNDHEYEYFENLFALERGIRDVDLAEVVANVQVPVYMIVPVRDDVIPRREYRRVWNAIPREYRGRFATIRRGHHNLSFYNAEPVHAELSRIVRELSAD